MARCFCKEETCNCPSPPVGSNTPIRKTPGFFCSLPIVAPSVAFVFILPALLPACFIISAISNLSCNSLSFNASVYPIGISNSIESNFPVVNSSVSSDISISLVLALLLPIIIVLVSVKGNPSLPFPLRLVTKRSIQSGTCFSLVGIELLPGR